MAVRIELDTENSCRKYQVCKPVTPRETAIEVILLRFFRLLTGFLYHYMYNFLILPAIKSDLVDKKESPKSLVDLRA